MAYTVLARKWRPHNFTDLVGQEHIVTALRHALTSQRLHHAYLLTGTRGVGKTTIARILAKCFNCETGITATPCDTCQSCRDINEGCAMDVMEIDAASRTKVEDTRDLLDNVQYMPTRLRYKIYLIDEVHMLSSHSFNALLKTLEEPPAHVIFILATTDPQKLPITVLSRCLQFHLKNMLPDQIQTHLQYVLTQEQVSFEPGALSLISVAAQGSMRDALSLLDQTIAYCAGNITDAGARAMLGTLEQHHVDELLLAIARDDAKAMIAKVHSLSELGVDYVQVADEIINTLHQLALYHHVPEAIDSLYAHTDFAALAEGISPAETQTYYNIALNGRRDLPLSPHPRYGFEMLLLRMMLAKHGAQTPSAGSTKAASTPTATPARATAPHQASVTPPTAAPAAEPVIATATRTPPDSAPPQAAHRPSPAPVAAPSRAAPPAHAPQAHTTSSPPSSPSTSVLNRPATAAEREWAMLVAQLPLNGMTKMIVHQCALVEMTPTAVNLIIHTKHASLLNEAQRERINEALNTMLDHPVKLSISVDDTASHTPAALEEEIAQHRRLDAIKTLDNDPKVNALKAALGATVIPDSISIEQ